MEVHFMIIDYIENIGNYAGISADFQTAVSFISSQDLVNLPLGKTEVNGERVFVNRMDPDLKPHDPVWEAHRKYADIQIILEGAEGFGWAQVENPEPYQEEKDFLSCHSVSSVNFTLTAGMFVIFLPGEAHAPGGCPDGVPCSIKKAVVKVAF